MQALALDTSPQRFIAAAVLLGRAAVTADAKVRARTQREHKDLLSRAPHPRINPNAKIHVPRLRGEQILARGQSNAAVSLYL